MFSNNVFFKPLIKPVINREANRLHGDKPKQSISEATSSEDEEDVQQSVREREREEGSAFDTRMDQAICGRVRSLRC